MRRLLLAFMATVGLFSLSVAGASGLIFSTGSPSYKVATSESVRVINNSSGCSTWVQRFSPSTSAGKVATVFFATFGDEIPNACVGKDLDFEVVHGDGSGNYVLSGSFISDTSGATAGKEFAVVTFNLSSLNLSATAIKGYILTIND